jgi:hypothetical protein
MLKSLGASRLVITSGNEFQQVLTEEEAADGEEVA